MSRQESVRTMMQTTNYMFFIFAVSFLAAFNSLAVIASYLVNEEFFHTVEVGVLTTINYVLALILFGDFFIRLYAAPKKARYFFHWGWLDLIGSFPTLAIFRVVRMYRMIREITHKGERVILSELRAARASGAMLLIVWLVLVVLEFAGVFVLWFERGVEGANITNASDALWWGFQTITTVGYGDRYPVTDSGRMVGVVLMTVGVGLFGTFTAWLANWFFGSKDGAGDSGTTPAEPADRVVAPDAFED